ncbi:MAG: aldo/keto reductase, partial [Eubacteriales bacterium]
VKIPCIGYGTWKTENGQAAKVSVENALRLGYRHIDTAFAYGNEESVGEGIRASGVKREDIFLTTKHWVAFRGFQKTVETFEASLKNLGTDYVDLYLVHWPAVEKVSPDWKELNASTWSAFEKLYRDGKIRAIGVSNFEVLHLEALEERADVMPMVNQIEFHPGYSQLSLAKYCREKGITVEAWSPLGSGAVLSDGTLAAIAEKYGKTVAQLCIRYALEENVLPLPKSLKPERIASNAEVFDFEISDGDMETLESISGLGFSGFLPEDAPADAIAAAE